MSSLKVSSVGWAAIPGDWRPYKEEEFARRHSERTAVGLLAQGEACTNPTRYLRRTGGPGTAHPWPQDWRQNLSCVRH